MSWKANEIKRELARSFIRAEYIELVPVSDTEAIVRLSMGGQIFVDIHEREVGRWEIDMFKLNKSGSRSKTFPGSFRGFKVIQGNSDDVENVVRVFAEVFEDALNGPLGDAWGKDSESVATSKSNLANFWDRMRRRQEALAFAEQTRQRQIWSGEVFGKVMIGILVIGTLSLFSYI